MDARNVVDVDVDINVVEMRPQTLLLNFAERSSDVVLDAGLKAQILPMLLR